MSRYSSNPFTTTHSDSDSDSDSDSLNCFITDLFETRSSHPSPPCSCHDININPFSDVVCDLHRHRQRGLELGLGFGDEIEQTQQNHDNDDDGVFDFHSRGLRVVGFGSDSDSSSELAENDDLGVQLCWDNLCLEDNRTLNEWEEVEERVNEREDSSSLVLDEVQVDGQSMGSGFEEEEPGEESLRYLEWEILLAVNNLERNVSLEHDDDHVGDSYLAIHDGFISAAEYDVLFGQFVESESVLKGSPPAAKSFVENLPLVKLNEEELRGKDLVCAVCKDEIMLEEKVRRLPCSHCYHGDCILPWLSIRNTCPVCRFELPTDDPDYEQSKVHRAAHGLLELAAQMQF